MVTEKELFEALASRHTVEGQKKISRASVAICGLGGLGSNVAIHLARCGVGRLHLLDFDRVDLPNINRQQYRLDQIGTPKTEALRDELRDFAPYINIVTDQVKLTPENITELLKDDEYIVEAFDKADQKAMLCNVVLEELPEAVLIAGSGMAGYGKSNEIQTRRVSSRFYICGDGETGLEQAGTLFSPRVAICAAHQANLVIQLIMDGE